VPVFGWLRAVVSARGYARLHPEPT